MRSSLRMKPSSLRPPQQPLAGALREDRGDLFFTSSVENRELPLYIGHYPGTPTRDTRGCPLGASEDHPRGIPSTFLQGAWRKTSGRTHHTLCHRRDGRGAREGSAPVGGVEGVCQGVDCGLILYGLLLPLTLVPRRRRALLGQGLYLLCGALVPGFVPVITHSLPPGL